VHEHVAKAGDAAKAAGEVGRQVAQLAEHVDGGGVVGGVTAGAGGQMRGDVERVLGAELVVARRSRERTRTPSRSTRW
jgi:hypothetical protein